MASCTAASEDIAAALAAAADRAASSDARAVAAVAAAAVVTEAQRLSDASGSTLSGGGGGHRRSELVAAWDAATALAETAAERARAAALAHHVIELQVMLDEHIASSYGNPRAYDEPNLWAPDGEQGKDTAAGSEAETETETGEGGAVAVTTITPGKATASSWRKTAAVRLQSSSVIVTTEEVSRAAAAAAAAAVALRAELCVMQAREATMMRQLDDERAAAAAAAAAAAVTTTFDDDDDIAESPAPCVAHPDLLADLGLRAFKAEMAAATAESCVARLEILLRNHGIDIPPSEHGYTDADEISSADYPMPGSPRTADGGHSDTRAGWNPAEGTSDGDGMAVLKANMVGRAETLTPPVMSPALNAAVNASAVTAARDELAAALAQLAVADRRARDAESAAAEAEAAAAAGFAAASAADETCTRWGG